MSVKCIPLKPHINIVKLGFTGYTVQPVLSKPCIKQAPVLSKRFHSPQLILHVNEPLLSKHLSYVASGHYFLSQFWLLAATHFINCIKNKYFHMGIQTQPGVKIVFTPSPNAIIHCLLSKKIILDNLPGRT